MSVRIRRIGGRWYLQIGNQVGLRGWIAMWLLQGIRDETHELRLQIRELREQVVELRKEIWVGKVQLRRQKDDTCKQLERSHS